MDDLELTYWEALGSKRGIITVDTSARVEEES